MAVLGKPEDEKQAPETSGARSRGGSSSPAGSSPGAFACRTGASGHASGAAACCCFSPWSAPASSPPTWTTTPAESPSIHRPARCTATRLLWSLIPMTIALYVTEEMCARMGVVTGKGLSDLIREEFGFRPTFFLILAGLIVDMGNVCAEFAGVAASMQLVRHFQIHFRAACRAGRLDSRSPGNFAPGRKNISGGMRPLSFLCCVRIPGQAGLAPGGARAR